MKTTSFESTSLENEYIYRQLSKLSVMALIFLLPFEKQITAKKWSWSKSDIINEIMDERLLPF